jgi:peptidoglycan/xylan/chitin deacetylase (PgdA/CDA1 family)
MLRLVGVFWLFRRINRNRLIILTYHSVLPSACDIDEGESRNVVDEQMFAWQMRYLARHFHCLRLEEAVDLLRRGEPLPPNPAVVTFDDGFRNNLRYALPILRRYGVPATVFVTTGHIGRGVQLLWTERVGRILRAAGISGDIARIEMTRLKSMPWRERDAAIRELEGRLVNARGAQMQTAEPNADRYMFLTWSEVQELMHGGVTIGSHTVEHPIMSSLDDERREWEVVQSKQEIERRLGAPCTLFSYPNGTADDFDECDKTNLRKAGYVAAVTQIAGTNDGRTDRFALKRLNIGQGHDPLLFMAQVSGFWPWMRTLTGRA